MLTVTLTRSTVPVVWPVVRPYFWTPAFNPGATGLMPGAP